MKRDIVILPLLQRDTMTKSNLIKEKHLIRHLLIIVFRELVQDHHVGEQTGKALEQELRALHPDS